MWIDQYFDNDRVWRDGGELKIELDKVWNKGRDGKFETDCGCHWENLFLTCP